MIGVTGSRHVTSRRRGSSPCTNQFLVPGTPNRRLSIQEEEKESEPESGDKTKHPSESNSRRESKVCQ